MEKELPDEPPRSGKKDGKRSEELEPILEDRANREDDHDTVGNDGKNQDELDDEEEEEEEVYELVETVEEDGEELPPEPDSDEVPADEIPDPRPPRTIEPLDDEVEELLIKLQGNFLTEWIKTSVIHTNQVKNLKSDDELLRMNAEQFQCIVCNNYPMPSFILGKDGVKKESVKICQCDSCNSLSCFNCWKKVALKDDPKCPLCKFKIDIPDDFYKKYPKKEKEEGKVTAKNMETKSVENISEKWSKRSNDNEPVLERT